jgi:hypothetical protein
VIANRNYKLKNNIFQSFILPSPLPPQHLDLCGVFKSYGFPTLMFVVCYPTVVPVLSLLRLSVVKGGKISSYSWTIFFFLIAVKY